MFIKGGSYTVCHQIQFTYVYIVVYIIQQNQNVLLMLQIPQKVLFHHGCNNDFDFSSLFWIFLWQSYMLETKGMLGISDNVEIKCTWWIHVQISKDTHHLTGKLYGVCVSNIDPRSSLLHVIITSETAIQLSNKPSRLNYFEESHFATTIKRNAVR